LLAAHAASHAEASHSSCASILSDGEARLFAANWNTVPWMSKVFYSLVGLRAFDVRGRGGPSTRPYPGSQMLKKEMIPFLCLSLCQFNCLCILWTFSFFSFYWRRGLLVLSNVCSVLLFSHAHHNY
jgi:hypothetical protein